MLKHWTQLWGTIVQDKRHQDKKRNLKVDLGKCVQMFRAPFLYLPGALNSLNLPLPWTSGSERVRGSGTRHTFSSTRRKEPSMEEGVLSENHWPRQVPTLSQQDHTHLNPNRAHLVHTFVHTMQCYFTFDS